MSRTAETAPGRRFSRPLALLLALAFGLTGALVPAAASSAATDVTGRIVDQLGQPAVGVVVRLSKDGIFQENLTTDANGVFTRVGLADGNYEAFMPEGTTDPLGTRFSVAQRFFTVPDTSDLGDLVVARYTTVSGTISNWSSTMGDVRVDLYVEQAPGTWQQVNINPQASDESTDGSFSITSPIFADNYTLRFTIDSYSSPYIGAYLGGELDDPALATHFPGGPGMPVSGLSMTMPAAALVTGRVTTGGTTPLEGINVSAQNEPAESEYDETLTDSDGRYSLWVRPGATNSVYAYDPANTYDAMTYNGRSGCGCDYDAVSSTVGHPATGINFDLVPSSAAKVVEGLVADEASPATPLGDIQVRMYRASADGWVLADRSYSDTSGPPNFGFTLNALGIYRLQFVDNGGHILTVTRGLLGPHGTATPAPLTPVPACYAALGDVEADTDVLAQVDTGTAAGACSPLLPPSGATGGSGGSTPVTRHHHVVSPVAASFPLVIPSTTPTPSASPTETPEPSASPAPIAGGPHVTPTSAPDLWWLLWVGLALLVVILVGGGIFLFRRR